MKHNTPTTRSKHRRHGGFTLLEVLLALGVFAIGFVFIAAIFPVAALLQKEAVDTINGQQVARNTEAIMDAMQLPIGVLTTTGFTVNVNGTAVDTDQRVFALSTTGWSSTNCDWTQQIRSAPTMVTGVTDRKFFWVPVFRDTNSASNMSAGEIYTYVFVLQKRNNTTYPTSPSLFTPDACANINDTDTVTVSGNTLYPIPKVFAVTVTATSSNTIKFKQTNFNGNPSTYDTPLQIDSGDKILDNNGTIYTVSDYDMTANTITIDGILLPTPNAIDTIWFASPGSDPSDSTKPSGKKSPTVDILILTDVVN